MADEKTQLERLLKQNQLPFKDAFSLAQLPGMLKGQEALGRAGRRAEAQVDAMLRAKYKDCGMEGNYQPPEDDVGDTYINCPVIGTAAIDAKKKGMRPWWRWLLGALLAVLIGAGIVYATARYFNSSSDYEVVAIPFDPNQ